MGERVSRGKILIEKYKDLLFTHDKELKKGVIYGKLKDESFYSEVDKIR